VQKAERILVDNFRGTSAVGALENAIIFDLDNMKTKAMTYIARSTLVFILGAFCVSMNHHAKTCELDSAGQEF